MSEILPFPSGPERKKRREDRKRLNQQFPLAFTYQIPELSPPPLDFEEHRRERERRFKFGHLPGLISSLNAEKHYLHDAEDKVLDMLSLPVDEQEEPEDVIGWLIPLNNNELQYLLYVTDTERIAKVPFGSDEAAYIDIDSTDDAELTIIKDALETEHRILGHIIRNQ